MTEKKSKMVSMRITERQYKYISDFAKQIRQETGFRITRASIMIKLMEYGLPHLEKEFPLKNRSIELEEDIA